MCHHNPLQVPSYNEDQLVPLLINDTDYAGNQLLALEQQRPSIDPSGELTRGADGVMQGAPGEDGYHYLRVDAAPPVIGYNKTPLHYNGFSYSCQGDVPERCGTEAEPVNIVFSSVPFLYAAEPVNASLALKDGKYAQVAIDNLGRGTII